VPELSATQVLLKKAKKIDLLLMPACLIYWNMQDKAVMLISFQVDLTIYSQFSMLLTGQLNFYDSKQSVKISVI
jgi:hypothetical protein